MGGRVRWTGVAWAGRSWTDHASLPLRSLALALLATLPLTAGGCQGLLGGDATAGAPASWDAPSAPVDALPAGDAPPVEGDGAATGGADGEDGAPHDHDAGLDAGLDAGPDAAADAGPPPECGPGSTSPLPDPCNDYAACTIDTCEGGVCLHTPDPACCTEDAQCDDGVACTTDTCNLILHRCLSTRDSSYCCVDTADCDDDDPCTDDVCAAHQCVFPPIPGCGAVTLCVDQNECTEDDTLTSPEGPTCVFTPVAAGDGTVPAGCCATAADCDDGDAATVDVCTFARCDHLPAACATDDDCVGSGFCTSAACQAGQCAYPPAAGDGPAESGAAPCCEASVQCDDGVGATQDLCLDHGCAHLVDGAASCAADADCGPSAACATRACVAGQCSVEVALGTPGCCAVDADCEAQAVACAATTCEGFACVEIPSSQPWPFHTEPFPSAAALDDWTLSDDGSGARWRWAPTASPSPPGLLYYGALPAETIDVGTTHGAATSPPIALPPGTPAAGLSVRFWRKLAVEPISSRDVVTLEVLPASGPPVEIWNKSYDAGPGLGWRQDQVPLPDGLAFPVQLRWSFDTIDAVNNDYAGVFVDDVELLRPCP